MQKCPERDLIDSMMANQQELNASMELARLERLCFCNGVYIRKEKEMCRNCLLSLITRMEAIVARDREHETKEV